MDHLEKIEDFPESLTLTKEEELVLDAPFNSLNTYEKETQQIGLIKTLCQQLKLPEDVKIKFKVNIGTFHSRVDNQGNEYPREDTTDVDMVLYKSGVPVVHAELNHHADTSFRDAPRHLRIFNTFQDLNPFVHIRKFIIQLGGKWFPHLSGQYWNSHDIVATQIPRRVKELTREDKRQLKRLLQRMVSIANNSNKYTGDDCVEGVMYEIYENGCFEREIVYDSMYYSQNAYIGFDSILDSLG